MSNRIIIENGSKSINSKWKSATTRERETAANMDGQDWNPVVMRKYKPGGAAAKPTPVSMSAVRKEKHICMCVRGEGNERETYCVER